MRIVGWNRGFKVNPEIKPKSLPIRDEPEGEVSFQYKMSLEGMAC